MSELKSYKNVHYIEPNCVTTVPTDNGNVNLEMTPELDDMCIAVDLAVEVKNRSIATNGKESTVIIMHWDGSSVRFLEGRHLSCGVPTNSKQMNVLTDSYTDLFYDDVASDAGTNEMFGISSIDINYNNYQVPIITINFIDVRGFSLMAQEEFRHRKEIDGMVGIADESLAGSFFKSFFTFPYPKFTLLVKGIYGEPVTYELTCSDFRINFDSNSGNFVCVGTFVGYTFSILNDITMNSIICAPNSPYLGSAYWESKTSLDSVSSGSFVLTDDVTGNVVPMPKLTKLLESLASAKGEIQKISSESPLSKRQSTISTQLNQLNELYNEYEKLRRCILDSGVTKENGFESGWTEGYESFGGVIAILDTDDAFEKFNNVAVQTQYSKVATLASKLGDEYMPNELDKGLISGLIKFSNGFAYLDDKKLGKIREIFNADADISALKIYVSNIKVDADFATYYKSTNPNDSDGVFTKDVLVYANGSALLKINKMIEKLKKEQNECQNEIAQACDTLYENKIGFKPTIKNIMAILMAHVETFMHIIHKSSLDSATDFNRNSQFYQFSDNRGDLKNLDKVVPLFPRVVTERSDGGIQNAVSDRWIGDLDGTFVEVDIINGLLNGINEVGKSVAVYDSKTQVNTEQTTNNNIPYPITPLDMFNANSIFAKDSLESINHLIGSIAIRMVNVMMNVTNSTKYLQNSRELGIADARNFYAQFPNMDKNFIQEIQELNPNDVIEISKKYGDDYPWGKNGLNKTNLLNYSYDENDKGEKILKSVTYNYLIGVRKKDGKAGVAYRIIPYSDYSFEEFSNRFSKICDEYGICNKLSVDTSNLIVTSDEYINNNWNGGINNYALVIEDIESVVAKTNKITLKDDSGSYKDDNLKKFNASVIGLENSTPDYDSELFYSKIVYALNHYNDEKLDTPLKGSNILPKRKRYADSNIAYKDNRFMRTNDVRIAYATVDSELKAEKYQLTLSKKIAKENKKDIYFLKSFTTDDYELGLEFDSTKIVYPVCLFTKKDYYSLNRIDKARIILLNLVNVDITNALEEFISLLSPKSNNSFIVNDSLLTLIGCLYATKEETYGNKELTDKDFKALCLKFRLGFESNNLLKDLFKIRKEVQKLLKDRFYSFMNGLCARIQSAYEVRTIRGEVADFDALSKSWYASTGESAVFEEYVNKNLSDTFLENYLAYYGDGLINRPNTSIMREIMDYSFKTVVFVKLIKDITNSIDALKYFKLDESVASYGSKYISGFLMELKKIYTIGSVVKQSSRDYQVQDADTSKDIKIAYYNYLKALYDRWIAGETTNRWVKDEFFNKSFYFIDAYYNKIGDTIKINMDKFATALTECAKLNNYSLLSFISRILQENRFQIFCVQNFADLSNKDLMKNMFKPIPYLEMNRRKKEQDFVIMYGYQPSQHLNIPNSQYADDGTYYNDPDRVTKNVSDRKPEDGYTLPAFGVSYGKQYQSYFTNISVSNESPIVTEQSLKAQYMICGSLNNDSQENGKNVAFIGQDLYTIYANNSYTCTVTMMGCAWVQPLMYFVLTNVPMFNGSYLIQKVRHNIEPGTMTTTIVGTRIASQSSRKVEQYIFSKKNAETGTNQSSYAKPFVENIANVGNNCEYKFFNVSNNSDADGSISPKEYEGMCTDHVVLSDELRAKYEKFTMFQFICAVAYGEGGPNDLTNQAMVMATIYNRYRDLGKWSQVLKVSAYNAIADDVSPKYVESENPKTAEMVKSILDGSPMVLVNNTNYILKEKAQKAKVFNGGVQNTNYIPKESMMITEEIVRSVYSFCGVRLYNDTNNKRGDYHRGGRYLCAHGTHVYCTDKNTNGKYYFNIQKASSKIEGLSDGAYYLSESIKKTVQNTDSTKNAKLIIEPISNSNENMFSITVQSEKNVLATVFDIILSTYNKYVFTVYWDCSDESTKLEYPNRLLVQYSEGLPNKRIIISKNGSTLNFRDNLENSIPDNFAKTLLKVYNDGGEKWLQRLKKDTISLSSCKDDDLAKFFSKFTIIDCKEMALGITDDTARKQYEGLYASAIEISKTNPTANARAISLASMDVSNLKSVAWQRIVETSGGTWNTQGNCLNIIGVRNDLSNNGNVASNKFIDIFVIWYMENGEYKLKIAPCTTVPGMKALIAPMDENGTAVLKPGYYNAWAYDKHKGQYYALCQRTSELTVNRDGNRNNKYDYNSKEYKGFFGVNIHKTSSPIGNNVNKESMGCQVFQRHTDFNFFMDLVRKQVSNGIKQFSYTLINQSDLNYWKDKFKNMQ